MRTIAPSVSASPLPRLASAREHAVQSLSAGGTQRPAARGSACGWRHAARERSAHRQARDARRITRHRRAEREDGQRGRAAPGSRRPSKPAISRATSSHAASPCAAPPLRQGVGKIAMGEGEALACRRAKSSVVQPRAPPGPRTARPAPGRCSRVTLYRYRAHEAVVRGHDAPDGGSKTCGISSNGTKPSQSPSALAPGRACAIAATADGHPPGRIPADVPSTSA